MLPAKWKHISDEGTAAALLTHHNNYGAALTVYLLITAKDLVKRLLVVDPSKRLTIDEALQHPWLQVTVLQH